MNVLKPSFLNRDGTRRVETGRIRWSVRSMDWDVIGGSKIAMIDADGPVADLWELIEWLRSPITIYDDKRRACWWGFVHEVRVQQGALDVGVTLENMTNSVAVAYTYSEPGTQQVGQRKTTAWSTDATSIAEYGTKQFLVSGSGLTDTAAIAMRDAQLALQKWPGGTVAMRTAGPVDHATAALYCYGWWATLDWEYASWPAVAGPAYTSYSGTLAGIGAATARTKCMQQFTVGAGGINVLSVELWASKIGSPSDNLVMGVYALDTSGNPTGSALISASVLGSTLGTAASSTITLSVTETALSAGVQYGLQVSRSGAIDASNYYAVSVNEAKGYTGGAFKNYNGSAWVARSPDADMLFQFNVNNKVETTVQIADLVKNFGQGFLYNCDFESASGYFSSSYRDGDTTAKAEIEQLLKMGGPNGRRYLAEVGVDIRTRIYEEPVRAETYYLKLDGNLTTLQGSPVMEWFPPVGSWVRLRDVIPASADTSKLADPTLQFVEGATWNDSGGLQLKFRGELTVQDVLGIR